jgi:nucleoside 2-deoxyribosyltransferase
MKGLVYMASPYSNALPSVREERFKDACRAAAWFMGKGVQVFSPIAHTHPIAEFGLPKGWDFWQTYDMAFLKACDGLIVLTLRGWNKSVGVKAEIGIMEAMGKPIEYWKLVGDMCQRHSRARAVKEAVLAIAKGVVR